MLSQPQVDVYKKHLLELQAGLKNAIALASDASKPVALDQSLQGRVSRGDAMQQQAMAKAGLARNRRQLSLVHEALQRIADNDYGFCLDCGEDIAPGRLDIMPEAGLCISCQQQHDA